MSSDEELTAGIPPQHPSRSSVLKNIPETPLPVGNYESHISTGEKLTEENAGIPIQRAASFRLVDASDNANSSNYPDSEDAPAPEERVDSTTAAQVLRNPILGALLLLCFTAFFIVILSEIFQFMDANSTVSRP